MDNNVDDVENMPVLTLSNKRDFKASIMFEKACRVSSGSMQYPKHVSENGRDIASKSRGLMQIRCPHRAIIFFESPEIPLHGR